VFLLSIACPVAAMAGFAGAFWWIAFQKRKSQEKASYSAASKKIGLSYGTEVA